MKDEKNLKIKSSLVLQSAKASHAKTRMTERTRRNELWFQGECVG